MQRPTLTLLTAGLLAALPAALRAQAAPDGFKILVEHARLPAISQDATGTCWSFATTSFLESEIQRIRGEQVDLSEMFFVYWAWFEKADRYVRLHGKTQFSQGGLSHDVIAMARRYGAVPAAAFTGLCGDAQRHDHGELEKILRVMVEAVAEDAPSEHWHDAVRGVLDAYLGAAPEVVAAEDATLTPQQYARDFLQLPLEDYVELMSYDYTPFHEEGELLVPDNWLRYQRYWNVPVEELMANLDHALENGFTVALDCDVSERTNDNRRAIYRLSPALEQRAITDDLRRLTFDSRETTDDHLMHIVGIAEDKDGKRYYLTKNSWGNGGPFQGHLMLTRNYLALKTLGIMVHRNGLVPETRARFEK